MMINDRPLVSIGVPVYNGARLLRECLESLVLQTYDNLEVVICDNASSDATQEICESFSTCDARVRYFRNYHNIGQFPNFRRTLSLSRGQFFTWACADDLRPASAIECCVEMLRRNPDAVMAHGAVIVEPRGAPRGVRFANHVRLNQSAARERVAAFTRESIHNSIVYGLYRRSVLEEAVFGDHFGQDYLLVLQASMLGPIEYSDPPIVIYRERKAIAGGSRMYSPVRVTASALLKEGGLRRRKCWTVLLLGCWYGLRLSSIGLRERLSAVGAHIRHFVPLYYGRLATELIFVLFEPLSRLSIWFWATVKHRRLGKRIARQLRNWAPSIAPRENGTPKNSTA